MVREDTLLTLKRVEHKDRMTHGLIAIQVGGSRPRPHLLSRTHTRDLVTTSPGQRREGRGAPPRPSRRWRTTALHHPGPGADAAVRLPVQLRSPVGHTPAATCWVEVRGGLALLARPDTSACGSSQSAGR